jgi:hypothetical protein
MKTSRLTMLIIMTAIALMAAACGGSASEAPAAVPATVAAPAQPAPELPAADQPTAADQPAAEAPDAAAPASACEEYFGFCITAQATGAVDATGAGGWASSSNIDCTALAAPGDARILELPNLLAAGEQQIAVALTRIGAYTGPGTYELAATATGGAMPDQFPAVRVGSRAFTNGADTSASVTVNADGSGTLEAKNLVEMDAMQGATPDPNARLDFAMQWTCQGQ